jgi:hypothetical protein
VPEPRTLHFSPRQAPDISHPSYPYFKISIE